MQVCRIFLYSVITWIRREDAALGRQWLQPGDLGEYRFCEAFCHR